LTEASSGCPVSRLWNGRFWRILLQKLKIEKRQKISQMLIFGELYRCNASQRRYEGPRLFLREMMWSLTFPRTNRISGLYNFIIFVLHPKKTFQHYRRKAAAR